MHTQGEESKIIILSLVRNNSKGKIGFLAMKNRINVLLSRAMHGMYILGNAESLRASSSSMWDSVLNELVTMDSLGTELEVILKTCCCSDKLSSFYLTICEIIFICGSSSFVRIIQKCPQKYQN